MCDNKTAGEKHDEVIVVRASKWWIVLFSLLLFGLFCILIKPDALREEPASPRELLFFRVWGLSMAALCFWGMLSALRFRLTLLPDEMVVRKLFSLRRFPLDKVEQLVWHTVKGFKGASRVQLKVEGHKEFRVDTIFALADYKRIFRYLRITIPLESQIGWKEYYLQQRAEWTRLSFKEEFVRLVTNFEELKSFVSQIFYLTALFGAFIGGAYLFGTLGKMLVGYPKILSGLVVFTLASCLFYILWKIHRGHHKTDALVSLVIKDAVAICCLVWIIGSLLGGIWDWWGSDRFRVIWARGFFVWAIGACVVGVIAVKREIQKENNKKPIPAPVPTEEESKEYEKYAELLLPPELER